MQATKSGLSLIHSMFFLLLLCVFRSSLICVCLSHAVCVLMSLFSFYMNETSIPTNVLPLRSIYRSYNSILSIFPSKFNWTQFFQYLSLTLCRYFFASTTSIVIRPLSWRRRCHCRRCRRYSLCTIHFFIWKSTNIYSFIFFFISFWKKVFIFSHTKYKVHTTNHPTAKQPTNERK